MTIRRAPGWGIELAKADYYGWRYCLHIGPWLVFCWRIKQ